MTNQVAIVTGAARPWGMGRATALGLARKGFDIVVADIREDWGGEAVEAIQAETGRRSVFISTDVSKKASAEALMRQTEASLGRIDVLANVAGVMVRERVEAITEEGADRIIAINLRGLMLMCQAVIPAMKRVGGGRIVNVSSGGAFQPLKGTAVYSATKAGVIAFTKVLAWEVAPHNIVATTVAPGVVGTNMGGEDGPRPRSCSSNSCEASPSAGRSVLRRSPRSSSTPRRVPTTPWQDKRCTPTPACTWSSAAPRASTEMEKPT